MQIAIGGQEANQVLNALDGLLSDAVEVSIAVSYLQLSGWSLLKEILDKYAVKRTRIVCTDQMGITDPAAVKAAIAYGADVRNYRFDGRTYHPKTYISLDKEGSYRFMNGSSNLSASALRSGVEVNTISHGDGTILSWFEDLFDNRSEVFTEKLLSDMDNNFRSRVRRDFANGRQSRLEGVNIENALDVNTLFDALFGDIEHHIGLLNFDHVGNTVRNLEQAKTLLSKSSFWDSKNGSELNRLGLTTDGTINELGTAFRDSDDLVEASDVWVRWLFTASDSELLDINPHGRLVWAKKALNRFWRFQQEIIDYFHANAHNPPTIIKRELQAIELLSNSRSADASLTLEDVKTVAALLESEMAQLSEQVQEYFGNKGARSWKSDDRLLITQSWKRCMDEL